MEREREGQTEKTVRWAAVILCIGGAAAGAYVLIRYGLAIVLPFLIAWGIALLLTPLAEKLSHGGKGRRAWSLLLLILLLVIVILLVTLIVNRVFYELQRFMQRVGEDSERTGALIRQALDFGKNLTSHLPFLSKLTDMEELRSFWESVDEMAAEMATDFIGRVSAAVPAWIATVLKRFPSFILFVFVTVISCFYFCLDLPRIHEALGGLLPDRSRAALTQFRRKAAGTAVKYLRAYLLLFLMTFGELLVGFLLLKTDYAFLLALLIAFVDILPVLGVGSVLVPWSLVLLLSRHYYRGLGLLILYACVTVIRQVAEPKIVGGSLGLHPLVTLVSMYAGFRLVGILGMLLGPALALGVRSFLAARQSTD